MWHKDMKGRLGILHAYTCAAWIAKVVLNGEDVTDRCRAIAAAPEGGGTLILLKHRNGLPYIELSEEFGEVVAAEAVQGRVQVKFAARAPLNSHSILKELFDGENPHNPHVYEV